MSVVCCIPPFFYQGYLSSFQTFVSAECTLFTEVSLYLDAFTSVGETPKRGISGLKGMCACNFTTLLGHFLRGLGHGFTSKAGEQPAACSHREHPTWRSRLKMKGLIHSKDFVHNFNISRCKPNPLPSLVKGRGDWEGGEKPGGPQEHPWILRWLLPLNG